jgi:hypothetical protein
MLARGQLPHRPPARSRPHARHLANQRIPKQGDIPATIGVHQRSTSGKVTATGRIAAHGGSIQGPLVHNK